MENKYALLLKTGEAELRALEHLTEKKNLLPIIELTRGRRSKNDQDGAVCKRINKIGVLFKGQEIILDITGDKTLLNDELRDLFEPLEGYSKWVTFCKDIKEQYLFPAIYPTIVINPDDEDFDRNLPKQAQALLKEFGGISYRCDIEDEAYPDDLELLSPLLDGDDKKSIFIIDCGYIVGGDMGICKQKVLEISKHIRAVIPTAKIILIATSYPNEITEDNGNLPLLEVELSNQVNRESDLPIIYGDYGSINPIRNDAVVMARGWRPKIDVPLKDQIYYLRERKGTNEYSATYSSVARKIVLDRRFPKLLDDNWGISQIKSASDGNSPGATPSFWISVRMNIHIHQQLIRMNLF